MIKQAMILAAGLGTRMKELTQSIPKPMLVVDGMSLIERHLHYFFKNNIHKVVINTYYKAEIFEEFIRSLPIFAKLEILFSREGELLGTAGGVKNALSLLKKDPFFIVNSDAMFVDKDLSNPSFAQLESAWNPNIMPMLMLLAKKEKAFGYWGAGDFDQNEFGQLDQNNAVRSFINPGMYLTDYRLFSDYPDKILQFYPRVMQDLMAANKLYGQLYDGDWVHIGDAEAYYQYKDLK